MAEIYSKCWPYDSAGKIPIKIASRPVYDLQGDKIYNTGGAMSICEVCLEHGAKMDCLGNDLRVEITRQCIDSITNQEKRCDGSCERGKYPNNDPSLPAPPLKTGEKKDEGKTRLDLVSSIAIIELAKVLTFGCGKYNPHNWRLGIAWSRVIAAALRHIFAWLGGENKDSETGLSHLAHAFCCIMFLLEYEVKKTNLDDRYKV